VIFTFIKTVLEGLYDALDLVLGGPPPLLIAVVLALLAFFAKGWKLAVGTLVGMLVIQSVGQGSNAMDSLALVLLASLIALLIGIPVGVWAAQDRKSTRLNSSHVSISYAVF